MRTIRRLLIGIAIVTVGLSVVMASAVNLVAIQGNASRIRVANEYIRANKGWPKSDYRIGDTGQTDSLGNPIFEAVHKDDNGTKPKKKKSVVLYFDFRGEKIDHEEPCE